MGNRNLGICVAVVSLLFLLAGPGPSKAEPVIEPIETQYIAALGKPDAKSGNGAQSWGLWTVDPGPRGVRLTSFGTLQGNGNLSPAGWKFDDADW